MFYKSKFTTETQSKVTVHKLSRKCAENNFSKVKGYLRLV